MPALTILPGTRPGVFDLAADEGRRIAYSGTYSDSARYLGQWWTTEAIDSVPVCVGRFGSQVAASSMTP